MMPMTIVMMRTMMFDDHDDKGNTGGVLGIGAVKILALPKEIVALINIVVCSPWSVNVVLIGKHLSEV